MIERYTKTVSVEAIRFSATKQSFDEIRAWVGSAFFYDYQTDPRVFLDSEDGTCYPVKQFDRVVKIDGIFTVMSGVALEDYDEVETSDEDIYSGQR